MFPLVAFTAASVLLARSAWAHAASGLSVAVVTEQFKNAKIVPDDLPAFAPTGLLTLNYTGVTNRTSVGVVLTKAETSTKPLEVYIRGTEEAEAAVGGPFNVTNITYTVITFDVGAVGAENEEGFFLHWLSNGWTYGENHDHTVTLVAPETPVVAYAGPAPPSGSGPHRYVTLVYAEPSNFTVPDTPAAGSGVARFDLAAYRTASGLTAAIAGTYFTVEEGSASFSIAATTAVDSTTLPQYTPTSTSVSPSGSAPPNGAVTLRGGVVALLVAAVVGLAH